MARFKNKDLHILANEEVLLGDFQEASIWYDGADLLTNQFLKHDTAGYFATVEFVRDVVAGLEWQNSVLSMTTDIPAGVYGDRYIVPSGASGAWSGLDDNIAEYTTTWVYTTPSAGFSTFVEDEGAYFVYSSSAWVRMGTVVDHSLLDNLDVDDHTQYLLVDGSRAIDTLTVTTSASFGGQLKMDTGIVPTDGQLLISPNDSGCLSLFAYSADNNAVGFDVRRTGGAWIAEDTSCAVIYKLSDFLQIMTRTGETPDTPVSLLRRAVFDLSKPVLYIGDETENTEMSAGLTINQGGADDQIFALKSSDVDHSYVSNMETDTYFSIKKNVVSRGGTFIQTLAEDESDIKSLFRVYAYGGQADDTKTSSSQAFFEFFATEHTGAGGLRSLAPNDNVLAIRSRRGAYYTHNIFTSEGSLWSDGDLMPFTAGAQDIGSIDLPWNTLYSQTVSASTLYGDGTGITGSDHGDLIGLDDDDHPIYLPSDGSRAMTGTLTVNTTGGFMRFSGLTADIGLASDTDMINLSSVGVTIDNNLTVTGSLSADHDTLLGLLDDDHTIYLNTTRHDTTDRHGASVVDHGLIGGLTDDDHPQYFLVNGSRDMGGDILPSASDTYDIGHSDAAWDNIWCKTLHTSAGSVVIGTTTLTDVGGVLTSDSEIVAPSGSDPSSYTTKAYVDEQVVSPSVRYPKGHLWGLELAQDSDADHDIVIAVGECRDAADSENMELTSVLTKRIDALWVPGDDNGGLASGVSLSNNTTYHFFLIKDPTGDTVDAGWDTSLTASNLLSAGYTKYRRIGSMKTDGSANIVDFYQNGDYFWLDVAGNNYSGASGTSRLTITSSAPTGIEFLAFVTAGGALNATLYWLFTRLSQTDTAPSEGNCDQYFLTSGNVHTAAAEVNLNTSAQFGFRSTGNVLSLQVRTKGWMDTRGKIN